MLLITVTYRRLAYLAQRLGGRASCAHQKPLEVGGVFHCARRLCEEACFARGEVPGLGQPVDCVGEGLRQGAGPQLQLVAGPGVVAAGVAVEDPDALAAPGQPRPESALCDVCRPAESGEKPR